MHLFYQPKQEYNGQPDYWWLRSPGTLVLVSYNACMAYPEGRVSNDYSGNNVSDSYGILKYINIFYGYTSTFIINFVQADYWWLRSPWTDNTNRRSSLILSDGGINHFVTGGGSNGWYIDNSYGRRPASFYFQISLYFKYIKIL